MAESLIAELLKQAPVVAALVYVVTLFLRHIRDSDTARETLLARRDVSSHEFQRDIVDKSDEAFGRMTAAMDRNSEALGRNHAALDRFHQAMDKLEGRTPPPRREVGP
jgi:hypothetical protein